MTRCTLVVGVASEAPSTSRAPSSVSTNSVTRPSQDVDFDCAGLHDRLRIAIVDQRQQQMFQGGMLMAALIGQLKCTMQSVFKALGE